MDPVVDGSVTFVGGADPDNFAVTGTLFHVRGALTLDLGEGANGVSIGSITADVAGAFTITGGTGADAITIGSASFTAEKGLTANLGAGDNSFTASGANVRIVGPLTVTHLDHAGTATTALTPGGTLVVTGLVTISYGAGTSQTILTAANAIELGTLKVTSTGGNDTLSFNSGGIGAIKGGITTQLGDGSNAISIAGFSFVTPTFKHVGGVNNDALFITTTTTRIGSVSVSLGDGTNTLNFSSFELRVSGPFKVFAGSGDDDLVVSGSDVRLGKGVQYTAGDGINGFSLLGTALQSGPLKIEFGEHATGTSVMAIDGTATTISGAINFSAGGGDDTVIFGGTAFAAGPLNLRFGEGANTLNLTAPTTRVGNFKVSAGNGSDTVTIAGSETAIGAIKADLGGGANTFVTAGKALIVTGAITVSTGAGDDTINFTHASQRLAKSLQMNLGDGLNNATLAAQIVEVRGSASLISGTPISGISAFNVSGVTVSIAGRLSGVFAGGDSAMGLFAGGAGKVGSVSHVGGSGNDTLTIEANASGLTLGAVTFVAGGGNNELKGSFIGSKIGKLNYTGGANADTLDVTTALGTLGAIKTNFGLGNATLKIISFASTRITALNVVSENQSAGTGSIQLTGVSFSGPVKIQTGDGVDTLTILDSLFNGPVTLDTRGGMDTVNIEATATAVPTIFRRPVNILTGAGADTLNIGANALFGRAEFQALAKFDGGPDADTAHISAALFQNIYLPGQPTVLNFETQD
jgi:hypothetical protein